MTAKESSQIKLADTAKAAESPAKAAEAPAKASPVASKAISKPKIEAATEAANFGGAAVETLVEASNELGKGAEQIGVEWMKFMQRGFERQISTAHAMSECKSIQDVLEKQSDYIRASYDDLVAETRKVSDLTANFATRTTKPVFASLDETVSKYLKPMGF